jgi:hypothetical protein
MPTQLRAVGSIEHRPLGPIMPTQLRAVGSIKHRPLGPIVPTQLRAVRSIENRPLRPIVPTQLRAWRTGRRALAFPIRMLLGRVPEAVGGSPPAITLRCPAQPKSLPLPTRRRYILGGDRGSHCSWRLVPNKLVTGRGFVSACHEG